MRQPPGWAVRGTSQLRQVCRGVADRAPGWVLSEVAPCTGPSQNASCFFNKNTLLNPFAFFPEPNPYLALGLVDLEDAFAQQQALGNRAVDNPVPSTER